MSRNPRARCGDCGRSHPEEETTLVHGHAQGSYRRAGRRTWRRVCRDCTQRRVDYARAGQEEGRNTPLDSHAFSYSEAAKTFGISITGLRLSQMSDRVAS